MPTPRLFAAALTLMALPSLALAQEATNTPAATSPSVGSFYFREKVQYLRLERDSGADLGDAHHGGHSGAGYDSADKIVATSSLAYGLSRTLSLSLDVPLTFEDAELTDGRSHDDFGVSDFTLLAKWRPLQWDLGPVDSVRVAFFAGAELPSGDGDLSSHSIDPIVGVVGTAILGRHGLNAALSYKQNNGQDPAPTRAGDGPADAVHFNTAYLYRLAPAAFSADTTAATYLTFETNSIYETNGDVEVHIGPGILYEARTFALEAAVSLPAYQDIDHRLEIKLTLTLGVRFLF